MKRQLSWTAIILLCGIAAISLGLAADDRLSGQALTVASDPEVDSGMYIFRLELDNGLRAEYSECSGLGSSHGRFGPARDTQNTRCPALARDHVETVRSQPRPARSQR
jgi:hypothetical protein